MWIAKIVKENNDKFLYENELKIWETVMYWENKVYVRWCLPSTKEIKVQSCNDLTLRYFVEVKKIKKIF